MLLHRRRLRQNPRGRIADKSYTAGFPLLDDFVIESENAIPVRRPLDLRAASLVLLLCVVWGFQQVALKGVAISAPPVMQLAIRFAGASIFFGMWVFIREGRGAFADGTLPSG